MPASQDAWMTSKSANLWAHWGQFTKKHIKNREIHFFNEYSLQSKRLFEIIFRNFSNHQLCLAGKYNRWR
jgi:hypothetical protein